MLPGDEVTAQLPRQDTAKDPTLLPELGLPGTSSLGHGREPRFGLREPLYQNQARDEQPGYL